MAALALLLAANEVPAAAVSKTRTSLELSSKFNTCTHKKNEACVQVLPVVPIVKQSEVLTEGTVRLDLSKILIQKLSAPGLLGYLPHQLFC